MKKNLQYYLSLKAASAAFALVTLSGVSAGAQIFELPRTRAFDYPFPSLAPTNTIPALPGEEEAFMEIEFNFHWQEPETLFQMKEFLSKYPSSAYSPYVELLIADWYFFNGEYSLALGHYNNLRNSGFSGDIQTGMLYRKAFSLLKNGYYSEAKKLFRRVVSSRDFGEAAAFYLAYIDYVNGKYDDAYKAFKEIQSRGISPKSQEALYYINQIDYLRGDYDKVGSTSEKLLKGDIPFEMLAETMRVGGLSYFKTGDKGKARTMLSNYRDLTGDGAEYSALYALATILYDQADFESALPLFTSVTEFDGPLQQSAWLYIGQILTKQGDAQGAALAFEKAGRQGWDPSVAETAFYNYAVSNVAGSSLPFVDSARTMESFIDNYPDSPYSAGLSKYLANSYYNLQDYQAALRQIDKISSPNAETAAARQKILYQLGLRQMKKGDYTSAVRSLTEASSSLMPDKAVSAQASLWLGEAYYSMGDYRAAVKAYDTAIGSGELGDNAALANYNLGYAELKLKDYKKAQGAFKKATDLKGLTPQQFTDARLRYADCLYYNGNYGDAMAVFRNIRSQGGQEGVYARLREADLLGREGKTADKIAVLEEIVNDKDAGIWRNSAIGRLADTYSETGNDKRAAELYSLILDGDNTGSEVVQAYYALATNAENLFKQGDRQSALEAYRRLEKSGIEDLYPSAVLGVARTSTSPSEVLEYAMLASSLPGLTAEEINEARFLGAEAGIVLGGERKVAGMNTLSSLISSSDPYWGARSAVLLGETLFEDGNLSGAEEVLTELIDAGSSDNYWLARGYIALADVYKAQDKDYLAKLYLESLRDNYPGTEKEILEMINSRLK